MNSQNPSMATTGILKSGRIASPRSVALVLAALLAILLTSTPSGLATRGRRKELRVGYRNFAPFVMQDAHGRPAGMAVEIVEMAARRASVRLRWIPIGEDVDDALRRNQADLFPLLTLSAARSKEFYTSDPWWENESALVSLETSPLHPGPDTRGRKIAIRGLVTLKAIAERSFPESKLVIIPEVEAMTLALCTGEIDAAFLDIRLLQSQLLRGLPACAGRPLFVASVPQGSLSLGTIARRDAAATADLLYAAIADLAIDGTLSEAASHWSMISAFQNRHMKEVLETRQRTAMMLWGLGLLTAISIVSFVQTGRIRHAHNAAEESRQRFDAFMENTPALALIKDYSGRIVYLNRVTKESGASPRQLQPAGLDERDREALRLNRCVEATERIVLESGEQHDFLRLRFPFSNSEGNRFVGSVALDVTERRKTEEALRFSQFSIDRSPDSILWMDASQKIFYANEAACRALGYSRAELLGLAPGEIDPALEDGLRSSGKPDPVHGAGAAMESSWRGKDGASTPVELALYPVEFDGKDFVCCIARDITGRKKAEAEMLHQAHHDLLTGLPNRRAFESLLDRKIDAARAEGATLTVCYFDLDGFKLINDTLGHSFGDTLLRELVHRLQRDARPGDILARMGGDEFSLILTAVDSEHEATAVVERLLSCLDESFHIAGHDVRITASAGLCMFPHDGLQSSALLQNADTAMYEAKRHGKNQTRFFRPAMNAAAKERLELESHLRSASGRGEFSLHFQPEISLRSNTVVRFEALLRWNHPVLGSIPPSKFIPVAEETGLIVPIGAWVLHQACGYGRRLLDFGSAAGVGVNVSNLQFCRPDFETLVADVLRTTGLPAHRLDLELTETVVMLGVEEVTRKIARLRALGVTISLDDFGTGYSSLNYLLQLRANNLKIDRSFVRSVPDDPDAVAVTRGLVTLAHSLGMSVVVEGVETNGQLEAIRNMGCDMAQGFLLGRPAPEAPLERLELAQPA